LIPLPIGFVRWEKIAPENNSNKMEYVDLNASVKKLKGEITSAKIKPGISKVKVLQPIP
jgi:hypothetical protein